MSSKTVQPIRRREQGETKSRRSARQKREKREIAQSSVPTTYFDYNLMLVIIFLTCFIVPVRTALRRIFRMTCPILSNRQ